MIGLLGRKVGMTQIFNEQGHNVPVTVLEVGPCVVTQVKTREHDGYNAVQLGFLDQKPQRVAKARVMHCQKAGVAPKQFLKEIRTDQLQGLERGATLTVDSFSEGDFVDVVGRSIGKGFQGVVKRHHFKGGPKSHGSMFGRVPGSIGQSSFPSRVFKGLRGPGHMGDEQVTLQNLRVVKVDVEHNLLVVKGSVPGVEKSFVVVQSARKRGSGKQWKLSEETQQKAVSQDTAQQEVPQDAAKKENSQTKTISQEAQDKKS